MSKRAFGIKTSRRAQHVARKGLGGSKPKKGKGTGAGSSSAVFEGELLEPKKPLGHTSKEKVGL